MRAFFRPGLLALDGTGVAREEASLLEVGAVVASLEEGAAMPRRRAPD